MWETVLRFKFQLEGSYTFQLIFFHFFISYFLIFFILSHTPSPQVSNHGKTMYGSGENFGGNNFQWRWFKVGGSARALFLPIRRAIQCTAATCRPSLESLPLAKIIYPSRYPSTPSRNLCENIRKKIFVEIDWQQRPEEKKVVQQQ